jgi:predicted phosphoribosyltransferase
MADRTLFRDRRGAGRVLAGLLERYRGRPDVVVLGQPRGGVPVAYEVATALGAPLGVFLVRKLGVPGHEEVAMGAIASGGTLVLNEDVVRGLRTGPEAVQQVAEREGRELTRREQADRDGRPPPELAGQTVILVDDGLATGASMRAAAAIRPGAAAASQGPSEVAAVRVEAVPAPDGVPDDDVLFDLVGDARLVLIGEASHRTHEFYATRARMTRRLIEELGFCAVAVEPTGRTLELTVGWERGEVPETYPVGV